MDGQESGKITPPDCSDYVSSFQTASTRMTNSTSHLTQNPTTDSTTTNTVIAPSVTGNKKWDLMYQHLIEYKKTHNDCLVPNRYKHMPQLGSWVSTQRRHYKLKQAGKDTPLTQQRSDLLTKVGFVWATKDPRHVPWEQRFDELLKFKKKYGHCLVPVGLEENPQLANWVSTQRQEWKLYKAKRPSRLTQEKISVLSSVGFVWEAQRGYKKRKICSNVCTNGGNPVEKQSTNFYCKQNTESDKMPGKAPRKKESARPWIAMFKEYLWYLDQNLAPEDIPALKEWAHEQRLEYKQRNLRDDIKSFQEGDSQLTWDQFKLLQSIKFDWNRKNNSDCVEKCPSTESETVDGAEQDQQKNIDNLSSKKAGRLKSSNEGRKTNAKMEVDAAEALFSMGTKNKQSIGSNSR